MRFLIIILLFLFSCKKYQVIQEVRVNMYHLHSPRHGVEVIITQDTLELGKWYKIKRINAIEIK